MAVYKADAIVIRSREYGEADKLLTLFSRERGKLEAVAKGVRKPKSTQRGGTQLFTYADFLLYKGKSLDTVNQVHPRESFIHLWDDFDRTIAASGIAELLDISTTRDQPEPELFTLTLGFLFLLKYVDPYIAQASYALRLLNIHGYLPGLNNCVECGATVSGTQAFLSAEAGGLLCSSCKNNETVTMLNGGGLALMRRLKSVEIDKLDRFRWNKKMRLEILGSLCYFCENKFERKLKAWRSGSELIV
ncbi:MAG: DNA repair protein RecO [Gracilibacter sp. BRH_c7a]|nr:MAG: DNA repair protein RecO [Gracilibacter sp. BRH_c7a]